MATESNSVTQSFLIHRHGARYPLRQPNHNVVWPREGSFWRSHVGRLTPVGVIQMSQLGDFFRKRYYWVDPSTVNIYSTHRSRALESAWSFTLGLMPDSSMRFNSINKKSCDCNNNTEPSMVNEIINNDFTTIDDSTIDNSTTDQHSLCLINYYRRKHDKIFGQEDPSRAYKININKSSLLQEYAERSDVQQLIDRLSNNGHLRLRRDSVTTIAKLKEIYSQIQIDHQLQIPYNHSLASHYDLTDDELELINRIGCEVMHRRLIPSTDSINNQLYNKDQGRGLLRHIYDKLIDWNQKNEFNVYSCHDTNMIALMSILGLKIVPPNFCGYILIERTIYNDHDIVAIYYNASPFDGPNEVEAKVWLDINQRSKFLNWYELKEGYFDINNLLHIIQISLIDR